MLLINCKNTTRVVEDSDVTWRYFTEIRGLKQLTDEEQRSLLHIVKEGSENDSENARKRLFECNQRFVASAARHLTNGENFNDLVSEGNIGLNKAIEKFDLSFKQHFITYAAFWINKYMVDYMVNMEKPITPKNANRVFTYANTYSNAFFMKNGRYPTVDELQCILADNGIVISNTDDLVTINMISTSYSWSEGTEPPYMGDFQRSSDYSAYVKATSTNNVDEQIRDEHIKSSLNDMLSTLDDFRKDILKRFYGIECKEETFDSIAMVYHTDPKKIEAEIGEALKLMRNKFKLTKYNKSWQD